MPTYYECDICKQTSPDPTGWLAADVMHLSIVGTPEPGSRGQLGPVVTLYFDKAQCRDAWCEKADVEPPPPVAPVTT